MMEFVFTSPLILEETFKGNKSVVAEVTLLKEGVSKNDYLYTIQDTDFNLVAETAYNKNIYYGANILGEHKAPKVKGRRYIQKRSELYNDNVQPVGKVIQSWFDTITRKVKAKIRIWDSDLVKRIRKGFKVSIRGIFDKVKHAIHKGKNVLTPIGLRIKDIQLLEPTGSVGIDGAQVDAVLEESLRFVGVENDDDDLIVSAVLGELARIGYLK